METHMQTKVPKMIRYWNSRSEQGQTMLFVLLGMSIFLMASAAFAVDVANIWFHRQVAQDAADAACTAGAMDLLAMAQGGAAKGNFPVGQPAVNTNFDCPLTLLADKTNPAPCWYASVNGYSSPGLTTGTPSNKVNVSFPASVPGITTPPTALFLGSAPFIQVNVIDRVQTFFMGLVTGKKTMDVGALATCGGVRTQSSVPIVVLDPRDENTVDLSGSGEIRIYGGPTRGIQINSISSNAIQKGTVDLSQGGPGLSGSSLGVTGATPQCCNFSPAAGFWYTATVQLPDPLALLPAPPQPVTVGIKTAAASGVHGCPDPGGCDEYHAGYYATGIDIGHNTAIFDPGIYYLDGDFSAAEQSCVRPSDPITAPGDGSLGTMFYFNGTGGTAATVAFTANSGKMCPSTNFPIASLKCTPTSTLPGNLPVGGLTGNVLVAPCTGTYGDQLGGTEAGGQQHGILFFQNRGKTANPVWHGGGASATAGTMYFHQCVTSGIDTGLGCSSATAYNDQFSAGGNACSSSFVIGQIITDQIKFNGTPCINMDLNTNPTNNVLKVSLLK